jgi:hypothetical protein
MGYNAPGSVGTGSFPWQFTPETYGAKGDGVTDDTGAINTAFAAAYAYALANNGYCELIFSPKTYLLSSAPSTGTLGTPGKCLAQIPLPVGPVTAQKPIVAFRGVAEAAPLYHWQQTATQRAGAVLKTTYGLASAWTQGAEPSVIGGPLPANGYGSNAGLFSNCLVLIDGVQILTPQDPHVCGVDLRGMAQARLGVGSVLVDSGPALVGSIAVPTQGLQFAVSMPQANNNDYCLVGDWSVEGQNYGIVASEHTHIVAARTIYCVAGLVAAGGSGSSTPHWLVVDEISVEACSIFLQGAYDTANPTNVLVRELDIETAGGNWAYFHLINDPAGNLAGEVTVVNWSVANPVTSSFGVGAGQALNTINGNLRILAPNVPRGHITPPAVPATTVALLNGSGHDAAVTVSGGTVTAITVDGTPAGITSGTVIVPTNKNISITYSVAPAWNWVLL